jgi:hypothetical protein
MKRKNARIQPDLFEQDEPRVLPALSQKEQLATLVEALLLERRRAKPRPAVAAVVLVAERHTAIVEADQPAVRDGDAVCVAGEIGEHRLGPGKGRLGIDEPVLFLERREVRRKGLPLTQAFDLAKKRQPARPVGVGKPRQEEPPEQTGQDVDQEAADESCGRFPARRIGQIMRFSLRRAAAGNLSI